MEDQETRRKIIREWMALPKKKRQTEEQVATFAKKRPSKTSSTAVGAIRPGSFGAIRIRNKWDGFCRALANRNQAAQPPAEPSLGLFVSTPHACDFFGLAGNPNVRAAKVLAIERAHSSHRYRSIPSNLCCAPHSPASSRPLVGQMLAQQQLRRLSSI